MGWSSLLGKIKSSNTDTSSPKADGSPKAAAAKPAKAPAAAPAAAPPAEAPAAAPAPALAEVPPAAAPSAAAAAPAAAPAVGMAAAAPAAAPEPRAAEAARPKAADAAEAAPPASAAPGPTAEAAPAAAAPAAAPADDLVTYWDPLAHRAWWVSAARREPTPMARPEEDAPWQLRVRCEAGERFAFVVEWTQEFTVSGSSSFFGIPHEEADLNALDRVSLEVLSESATPPECPKMRAAIAAAVAERAAPLERGPAAAAKAAEADEVAVEEAPTARGAAKAAAKKRPKFESMGSAEFLIELEDLGRWSVDAAGARVSVYAADQVSVQAVTIEASDGSWGPLPLQLAELAPQTSPAGSPGASFADGAKPQEGAAAGAPEGVAGVAAGAATGAAAAAQPKPAIWLGVAPDIPATGVAAVVVKVRRRNWRVDPRALELVRGDGAGAGAESGGGCEKPPAGPALWSVWRPAPPSPPSFERRPDRELVLYELHVGSFTPEGTFAAATAKLGHVRDLGCTAVSVMPVHQDARRLKTGGPDFWGYDVISAFAVDVAYGSAAELAEFVAEAHRLGLAVIVDYIANHMMWGAESVLGPQFFKMDMPTPWGPRPDFSLPAVRSYFLDSAEFLLSGLGCDGLRVDSTKSIRKFPNDAPDGAGTAFLGELASLCRRRAKLIIAEDLEDGDGVLQLGGLGFHMQWDMAFFCWAFEPLVNPLDSHRDLSRVVQGLQGLCPSRGHLLRGRVVFMESHDTAASDRYGRFGAAVHNGKAFMPEEGGEGGGDAFQKASGEPLPYPSVRAVEANSFAARRAAIGLTLMMTAPGVPMLLQGQEVYEVSAFKWPKGPRLDWERVAAEGGCPGAWQKLCRALIAARLGGALLGDGLHVCHSHGGVLAYLRWAEEGDSRTVQSKAPDLALVVLNFTNNSFPCYDLGVPPSNSWRLAVSTVSGTSLSTGEVPDLVLNTTEGRPCHGFPCVLSVTLPPYSAAIFFREA